MLRPERMSKVSVTGSKGIMPTVIETVHELNLVHLSDYDGSWEGFDNGNPIEGADQASEKLVTVRALESTLELSADEAGPGTLDEGWEQRLEEIRTRINELDDRRGEVNTELREADERIDRVEPFAELGIDLDLLSGYETVDVAVVEGRVDAIEDAVAAADDIRAFETFTGGDVVAIVAAPAEGGDENPIDDALVGVDVTRHEVPDTEQSPADYVADLEERKRDLESQLEDIDAELAEIKRTEGDFLLRVEEKLTIEVQQAEAPLQFATSEHAFVAEGWIPTEEYDRLVADLSDAVGDSVEIEELERADYDRHGAHAHTEEVQKGTASAADEDDESAAEADEEPQKAVTDGGSTVTMNDEPPVIQDNPGPARPFEVLVQAVNRPKYSELDPTIFLFLTFPAFFGFMIGDVGYGILYVAIGYYMYSSFDSDGIRSLGGVAIWAGLFTILFGALYGEIFGLHVLGEVLWEDVFHIELLPLAKGLEPAAGDFALGWMVISVLAGIFHLNIGYILDFYENLSHGVKDAVTHSGSWLLLLNGVWIWIFSVQGYDAQNPEESTKPAFLFETFSSEGPLPIGFEGFPEMGLFTIPGTDMLFTLPLLIALTGLVLLIAGDAIEAVEALDVVVNVFSYTRMAAVLLAKAGMAFVVNLLFFGGYEDPHGSFHFLRSHEPAYVAEHYGGEAELIFSGLMHSGTAAFIGGIAILVLGHLLVLALGVTSAGLQAVRLEYVEFFNKFYEGGGENYEPFGHDRTYGEDIQQQ
ncbi:V-type ATP synthase subunit I [Natrinema salifodinae]|uniref:A-type ATP synthase subunit I n=1 Tax=Natrinema salifodinae TaxID=1202768 RepID=A0A1I0PQK4_9EURY|nr:V-type ATP synthase subunit I [Natrinema salifodinae]SEW16642.1 V/A-type H+-transporting ATPase subunit I [Natrinema salifodinae]